MRKGSRSMQSRNTADKQLTAAMGKLVLRATSSLDEPTENSSRIVLAAAADNVTADFVFESPRVAKKTNVDPELAGSSEVHVNKLMRKPSSRRTIRRRTLKISRETDGRQFRLEQFNWLKTVGKYSHHDIFQRYALPCFMHLHTSHCALRMR